MTYTDTLARRILGMVRVVERDEPSIGVLSTGEQIAVALVMERLDLLPTSYPHLLEAVERLGDTWTTAALRARAMREDERTGGARFEAAQNAGIDY